MGATLSVAVAFAERRSDFVAALVGATSQFTATAAMSAGEAPMQKL